MSHYWSLRLQLRYFLLTYSWLSISKISIRGWLNLRMGNLWIPRADCIHCTNLLYIRHLSICWYWYPWGLLESIHRGYWGKTNNKYFFPYFLFHILFQLDPTYPSNHITNTIFHNQLFLSHLPKVGFANFLLWIPIELLFLFNYHWSGSLISRVWDGDIHEGIFLGRSLGVDRPGEVKEEHWAVIVSL